MAGHSKWANIRHRKGKADAKKGKIFSRVSKEIITAVKLGGADLKSNNRLRIALQKAREANVPNDNIERNIKKGLSADQAAYDEITYELYGHGGVGIILDIMTDNRNRISSDIRIATNKRGGTVAIPGAVAFNFDYKGLIQIAKEDIIEDTLFLVASEAGAEDFSAEEDDVYVITTDSSQLYAVKETLETQGFTIKETSLEYLPKIWIECNPEATQANYALIEWLEGLDDVDTIYHNMKEPEEE